MSFDNKLNKTIDDKSDRRRSSDRSGDTTRDSSPRPNAESRHILTRVDQTSSPQTPQAQLEARLHQLEEKRVREHAMQTGRLIEKGILPVHGLDVQAFPVNGDEQNGDNTQNGENAEVQDQGIPEVPSGVRHREAIQRLATAGTAAVEAAGMYVGLHATGLPPGDVNRTIATSTALEFSLMARHINSARDRTTTNTDSAYGAAGEALERIRITANDQENSQDLRTILNAFLGAVDVA
jgi:hypothetical protein